MPTHQEIYDVLLPLIAELINKGALDKGDLARTYENFAAVAEQEDKPTGLLLAIAEQLRRTID